MNFFTNKSIISVEVFFKFNGLSSRLSIVEHKDFLVFMANAIRNKSEIDCFRVSFGSDEFAYGSNVVDLATYLENSWFEEVEKCDCEEEEDVQ